MNKTKIIFVFHNLGAGGIDTVLINLWEALDKNKYELICIFYDSNHKRPVPDYLKTYYIGIPLTEGKLKIKNVFLRVLRIAKIFNKEHDGIILSLFNRVNLTVILAKLFSKNKLKLIISERNTPSLELADGILSKIDKYLIKILYPLSDKIIAVSKGVKNDLVCNFNQREDSIEVIYNPLNVNKIKKLAQEKIFESQWFDENIPIILNVAKLANEKGQEYLIKAFKIIRSKLLCRLVIIGEGKMEKYLKQLASFTGFENDIIFLGLQLNPYKFMARSTVFAFPSLMEGFGNVIIEAMVCGIPVVSMDCPYGPNEIIEDKVNGILVPVKDHEKLADAIYKIIQNPDYGKSLVQEANKTIDRFSISRITLHYENFFEKVLNQ